MQPAAGGVRQENTNLTAWNHAGCIACGSSNGEGLHLQYERCEDGGVITHFDCDRRYAGYSGVVHGGIVALLLDSAMTHGLFARDHKALTAELTVRFHEPVTVDERATICARVVKGVHRLYLAEAELMQNGYVKATGKAKFVRQRDEVDTERP